MSRHLRILLSVTTTLLILDQVSKHLVRAGIAYGKRVPIIDGFFNLTFVENKGAAWGMFSAFEHRIPFFAVITVLAMGMIGYYFRQLRPGDDVLAVALACIAAGALGNFVDRMIFHKVTDFLDFYATGAAGKVVAKIIGSTHWPAFNVADIAIFIGVGLFLLHLIFFERAAAAEEARLATGSEGASSPDA